MAESKKLISVRWLLLGLLFLFLLVFLWASAQGQHQWIPFNTEASYALNEGWEWQQSDGSWQGIELPAQLGRVGPTLTLRCTLPEHLPIPTVLCFRSSHQSVEVLLEGKSLYSFGLQPGSSIFGKTPGSGWHMVRLSEGSTGQEITLRLTTPYPSYQGTAPEMRTGSKAALLFYVLGLYLPAFVLTTLIFLLGGLLLLVYLLVARRTETGPEIFYLGLFAILVSMWMYGESRMVQFFLGNQFISYCLTFITMLAAPIPVFKYICCFKDFRYQQLLRRLCDLLYLSLATSTVLQFFNVFDFIEMLPVLHVVLFVTVGTALIALLIDWLRNRNPSLRVLSLSLCILLIFALLELPGIYRRNSPTIGNYMRLGVLLFIAVQAYTAIQQVNHLVRLSRVAGQDTLTGCKNRTAYIQQLNKLDGTGHTLVIMADLNDLKQINDHMGHLVGDDALTSAGHIFQKTFGALGDCYRIGGDEFVFLGQYMGHRQLHQLLRLLEQSCQQQRQQGTYPFSLAYGYATFTPGRDERLVDTVRRADQMMYRVKRLQKRRIAVDSASSMAQVT